MNVYLYIKGNIIRNIQIKWYKLVFCTFFYVLILHVRTLIMNIRNYYLKLLLFISYINHFEIHNLQTLVQVAGGLRSHLQTFLWLVHVKLSCSSKLTEFHIQSWKKYHIFNNQKIRIICSAIKLLSWFQVNWNLNSLLKILIILII